jgi:glycopeptide antibiotics resistance protein
MTKNIKNDSGGVIKYSSQILLGVLGLFLLASVGLGEFFNIYEKFWWWDDVLHTLAGVIMGLLGFLMVYFFNARYKMTISPVFVAVFAFGFAMIMSVIWEIFEFSMDVLFGTPMQRWNLPSNAMLIGKDYQGVGLRDTMSDLIVCSVGALIAAIAAYYAFKHKKRASLSVMKRTVGRLRSR